ncbi:MAG: deoxyhypusine synthase family protein [Elusimicrobia bacterium]|nr:deoxyhypusine synthase family protein [Elusimicrobiota bacterium]
MTKSAPRRSDRPLRFVSLKTRASKVRLEFLGSEPKKGGSFKSFFNGLPAILAAQNLREFVEAVVNAKKKKRPVLMMFGAHVIKTGLSRYIITLMEKGWVTALATNGAGVIHDFELAFAGQTSEDVPAQLKAGIFGFARETGQYLNGWAREAAGLGSGLGETIGQKIAASRFPNRRMSLFARAYGLGVPATVHAAIGTDIVYQHPNCDGGAWGQASYTDFKRLTEIVGDLAGGGVIMNWGSAVLMPEVLLKAIAINRNKGRRMDKITAANFDMIPQYRPRVNVLERPTLWSGSRAFNFIGHHEILLPLVSQALVEHR